MQHRTVLALAVACAMALGAVTIPHAASAQNAANQEFTVRLLGVEFTAHLPRFEFAARLDGFQQVPSVFTTGQGRFEANLDDQAQQLTYMLSYSDLTAPVLFAHIHFGKARTNGGVLAFLCGGGGKPACPQSGNVKGTIVPSDVQAIDPQGVEAGNFDALVAGLVSQSTYVNVHSERFPDGEIRGQIIARGHDD
jgi:hypothetical protein